MNKPVAWMYKDSSGTMKMLGNTQLEEWVTKFGCKEIPLYTHPVKELTDEEIMEVCFSDGIYDCINDPYMKSNGQYSLDGDLLKFAKAILRKAQEK